LLEGLYGDIPDHITEVIHKAYDNNERQINIVNSLLKVALLDAGKVVIRKAPVVIDDLMENIAAEYTETSVRHKQKVSLMLENTSPLRMDIDTDNMRMAIANLVDNAIKYTPECGVITLRLSRQGDEAVISISDTGVGIDEADLPRLFGKFVRLPNSLSQKVGGSGLGLYWVKKVVELHGGRVGVVSAPGEGATFSIYLPDAE